MIANKLLSLISNKNGLRKIPTLCNLNLQSRSYNTQSLLKQQYSFSSTNNSNNNNNNVSFFYVNKDGNQVEVQAKEGDNLLEIAHQNNIDLEGACEMSLACSTCHVILEDEIYDQIEKPTMEEEDLLDLAYGLTDTSRLGCQVKVSKLFQGAKITLPKATRNFYVDGHKPKPH